MAVKVLRPGVMTTLQGAPRFGQRHQGIPASGPADPLSMALANRLVSNAPAVTALEITFGAEFEFHQPTAFAFAGAAAEAELSGVRVPAYETLMAAPGDRLHILHPAAGVRTYLAIPGGFQGKEVFGSASTFLPAAIGGFEGRALKSGDSLSSGNPGGQPGVAVPPQLTTPGALRPHMARSHSLRAVPGPDYAAAGSAAWEEAFLATGRMDRTGLEVSGSWPRPENGGLRPSAALFTGAVQLTPSGHAFVLLPDAQTTGGYPHVLQVIRADRHLLGQIAPGDRIRFLKRSVGEAYEDLKSKAAYLAPWLPGFDL